MPIPIQPGTTLQFRVYLYDPTKPPPERPVQAFFTDKEIAKDWAAKALKISGKGSQVWLYELGETLQGFWTLKTNEDETRQVSDLQTSLNVGSNTESLKPNEG